MRRTYFTISSLIVILLICSLNLYGTETSETIYNVFIERDVKISMRDGIRLAADIYHPDTPGTFPALLIRTPYNKRNGVKNRGIFFAKHGYAVLIQDVRGRFASEGTFYPMQTEKQDGYLTQQWIAAQPWCNKKIGTSGGSYVGFIQWMPAPFHNPYLVTMLPAVTFSNLYENVYYGGAFRLGLSTSWAYAVQTPYGFDLGKLMQKLGEINKTLPLLEQDKLAGWKVPLLRDILLHPENDQKKKKTQIDNGYASIRASVFNIGGWFDICLNGTLNNYLRMTSANIRPDIRKKQKLLIGPWIHGISRDRRAGDLDFGEKSVLDLLEWELRWFDNQLKGIKNGIDEEDPIMIFVMGENKWRTEKEWPLARTQYRNFYFHSNGNANTLHGDGTLNTSLPSGEPADQFIYDPDNPVPSDTTAYFNAFACGPKDQRLFEERDDVLVYTTPPLQNPIEVTGPVKAVLYAASSAVNTDFTAKLVDVYQDGKAIRLCDGIIRASFRNPGEKPSTIKPNNIYRYEIDLWATSNVFKKGHRIRMEISSSNFPRFDRNLNTGKNFATDTTWVKAEQTIYHSSEYPSCIVLPVIEYNNGTADKR